MKLKKLDIIFFFLALISAVMVFLFFKIWNPPAVSEIQDVRQQIKSYDIERCLFSENAINVDGWINIGQEKNFFLSIYAEKKDGTLVPIEKNIAGLVRKPDDRIGLVSFKASRYIAEDSVNKYKKSIILLIKDDKDNAFIAKYSCK